MVTIPAHWHIDCPFGDAFLMDPVQATLRAEFVVHMGRTHGTDAASANHYFTNNCHE
jgi:hypothetical protein